MINRFRVIAQDAVREGRCVSPPYGCGKILDLRKEFRDDLSIREWNITGMCQTCQDRFDEITRELEEHDEEDIGDPPF